MVITDMAEALEAVRNSALGLAHCSDELRNDPAIVLAAVRENVVAFAAASDELRNDPAIVLTAVRISISAGGKAWEALQFASEELRVEAEICSFANTYEGALEYIIAKRENDQMTGLAFDANAKTKGQQANPQPPADMPTPEPARRHTARRSL